MDELDKEMAKVSKLAKKIFGKKKPKEPKKPKKEESEEKTEEQSDAGEKAEEDFLHEEEL